MIEDNSTIKNLHSVELEILTVVDEFCKKHSIPYSLYGGTLLGAVRHKGFIPWDDDVDVCMMREDYERFIALWERSNNHEYILQYKGNTPKVENTFAKIRKNNTTFRQSNEADVDFHTGIFIDIFPFDRYPRGVFRRLLYKWDVMRYLLYTREFLPQKSNKVIKFVSKVLLMASEERRNKLRIKLGKKICRYNKDESLKIVDASLMDGLVHLMPCEMPKKYTELEFEGKIFSCYDDYDGLLSAWYGNYMELPPESERVWRHKPLLLDFNCNYSDIKDNKKV